jgi:opacity protein-like surface antigen
VNVSQIVRGHVMNRQLLVTVAVAAIASAAGAANAAHMSANAPVYQAAPIPSAYSWTGFYAGANVGYAFDRADFVLSPSPNFLTSRPTKSTVNR